ncbi:MAG: transporter substrate-binding domain-containing protein [Alphaproteobacteria bacterium]|nr:transporter substrate-binding domain-containing protein [Alphaproteobacteria bacterium]
MAFTRNLSRAVTWTVATALISVATFSVMHSRSPEGKAPETAYSRALKTQTIRCGYVPFPPNFVKDPNTGKISGLDYDITEALGRKLGMKIVWAEETGWGTAVAGLDTGRFDALCNAYWINPSTGRQAYFARPYYYQPLFVVTRAKDARFNRSREAINDSGVKIASMDGDNPKFIAEEDFPKAQIFTLPDMAGMGMVFESVATGKADLTFASANDFGEYNEHNRGKLKLVLIDQPVRIYPAGFILPLGDDKFRSMIDTAMDELIYSGQVDAIVKRYAKYPHGFIGIERPRTLNSAAP